MAQTVVAIGAANIDIQGFSESSLFMKDSNPGYIQTCLGGVSRNICENLVRLGIKTHLITALGDDSNGKRIRKECEPLGIDLSHSITLPGKNSSSYMAIMDDEGDMALALSDVRILDELPIHHLKEQHEVLSKASALVMDAGLSPEVMRYLSDTFSNHKTFLDPVSVKKCYRMEAITGNFYCLKMNRLEAGYLSGVPIMNEQTLSEASRRLLKKGLSRIYVTLGKDGIFYAEKDNHGLISAPDVRLINATGAGDAVTAAVVYGELQEWSMKEIAQFAIGAATIAITSNLTVSTEMNVDHIRHIIKER